MDGSIKPSQVHDYTLLVDLIISVRIYVAIVQKLAVIDDDFKTASNVGVG